jgi:hypothetical protein
MLIKASLSVILFLLLTAIHTGNYSLLCKIEMDLSGVDTESLAQTGPEGKFYLFHYKVILMFGLTELKAQVAWKENVSRAIGISCKHRTLEIPRLTRESRRGALLRFDMEGSLNYRYRSPARIIYD